MTVWRLLGFLALFIPSLGTAGSPLERMDSRGDMLGWEAVGRIDTAGKGFCTGVLIATDQVLTAAHCLYDKTTGRPWPAEDIVFHSGYLNGEALSVRGGDKFVVAEGYDPDPRNRSLQNVAHDVAILRLAKPIHSAEADPFRIAEHGGNGQVQVMSYGQGRAEAMSWQRQCQIQHETRDLTFFDCDITFGSSGAPVFVKTGSRVRIFSLVSGLASRDDGTQFGVGMALPERVRALQQELRYGAAAAKVTQGARRIQLGGNKNNSGAKFIRAQ